jgi:hypothetical protein
MEAAGASGVKRRREASPDMRWCCAICHEVRSRALYAKYEVFLTLHSIARSSVLFSYFSSTRYRLYICSIRNQLEGF